MVKGGAHASHNVGKLAGFSLLAFGGLQGVWNLYNGTTIRNSKDGKWHGFTTHIFSHIPGIGLLATGQGTEFINS
ncbi:MAG: hypothetical protein SP1CHLAM54_04860 [Chlamydiia bacterium]|nr:hypothetical protein [Chlamydiia bacterium]MCH9615398.1 hypothetical protein [Chlamydiia bacterium]MCH9628280.1 hypothetical protein [Chlamydiia bacterium]